VVTFPTGATSLRVYTAMTNRKGRHRAWLFLFIAVLSGIKFVPVFLDVRNVLWNEVSKRYNQFTFAGVFDRFERPRGVG